VLVSTLTGPHRTAPATACAGDGRVAPATTNGGETAESATNSGAVDAARDEAGALDPEVILSNAGALEQCEDGEDLCLSEAFKRAWDDAMADFDGEETADLAERAGGSSSISTSTSARSRRSTTAAS